MIEHRHCKRCGAETRQEISCRVVGNGAEHFGWWCLRCRWWTERSGGGIWISRTALEIAGVDASAAPVVERLGQPRCARCGARGAEEHHWAPKGLFGGDEAERWPRDFLCKRCHDLWHRTVTPALVRGDEF